MKQIRKQTPTRTTDRPGPRDPAGGLDLRSPSGKKTRN